MRLACLLIAATAVLTVAGSAIAQENGVEVVQVSHVSGKPVPRFEALRYAAVNGRLGPSEDHPIAWRYERAGLPMLIVKETRNWRFVRDPDGDEVWVHARMLAPAHTAMAREAAGVFSKPDPEARVVATLAAGAMVTLGRCEAGYCHVEAGRMSGWAALPLLWGAGLEASSVSDTAS